MKHILFFIGIFVLSLLAVACGNDNNNTLNEDNNMFASLKNDSLFNPYTIHFDSMPPGGRKLQVYSVGPFRKCFNDSNHTHLTSAIKLGIKPINDAWSAWNLKQPIVKIKPCREYFVDELTHSYPFLVPKAANLLKEIGQRFNDSLATRGGGDYRIKVTSVLRTPSSVAKLRRRNRNATETSAHQFGTTFDISYIKFICDSVTIPRTQEDLKNLLAEVLFAVRNEHKCHIKYERRQGCFHITAQ